MAIAAHFEEVLEGAGKAREPRRKLHLETQGAVASGATADVLVHNVSATGLLLESQLALTIGERIEIDLPHAGPTGAKVIWTSQNLFGCEFDSPISTGTLSAAQLRSAVGQDIGLTEVAQSRPEESFGARLQRLRKRRSLTLAQLAAELGVSKPTVWAWEQGKARPVESRIDALAEALETTRAELLVVRDNAVLPELLARCREQIAGAAGTSADKIRIMIEL